MPQKRRIQLFILVIMGKKKNPAFKSWICTFKLPACLPAIQPPVINVHFYSIPPCMFDYSDV